MRGSESYRVCLGCRMLLEAAEDCDLDPEHRVVEIADDARGLRALRDAVWANRDAVPYLRILAWVAAAMLLGPLISVLRHRLSVDGLLAVGALYAVFLVLGFVRMIRIENPPVGVALLSASELGAPTTEGRVTGDASTRAPLSRTDCAAFGVWVSSSGARGGPVILRDARAAEIDLIADDGESVRIPAGRIRVVERGAPAQAFGGGELRAYLGELGGALQARGSLLAADEAFEVVIAPGDRVALYGEIGDMADTEGGGYRGTRWLRVALGVPVLELRRRPEG